MEITIIPYVSLFLFYSLTLSMDLFKNAEQKATVGNKNQVIVLSCLCGNTLEQVQV